MGWEKGKPRVSDTDDLERLRVSVTFPGSSFRRIEQLAVEWGCTKAEVVRRLVRTGIDHTPGEHAEDPVGV